MQVYSVSEGEGKEVIVGTVVRLEEAKFILKLYAPLPPAMKGLLLSLTTTLVYILAR
jgi:hypothetical protein